MTDKFYHDSPSMATYASVSSFGPGKTIEHQPKTQRLKPNSHCSWELQITINLLGLVLGLNYQARMICPNHYYNITYSMYILYISPVQRLYYGYSIYPIVIHKKASGVPLVFSTTHLGSSFPGTFPWSEIPLG